MLDYVSFHRISADLGAFFLIIGFLGLALSTVAAPAIGWLFSLARSFDGSDRVEGNESAAKLQLEVLIAAYNEADVIERTLRSLIQAADRLKVSYGDRFDLKITVGLDHCTDATAERVHDLASQSPYPIVGFANPGLRGKWNTLVLLIARSQADWVACVDAGSVWDEDLWVSAWPLLGNGKVLGVSPSYCPRGAGAFERLNWRLEQALKKMENASGGPVSVHGATVLYRRTTLLNALSALQGTQWLNDDVVVPLTLRLQNPHGRIVYLAKPDSGWVSDVGIRSELAVEYGRRRRMVMGNLQWIRAILLPQLGIIWMASRRVFRVFWAYWILFASLGIGAEIALALHDVSGAGEITRALLLELLLLATAIVALSGLLFSNWIRRLGMAFLSGLMVARYWNELSEKRGVSWL